MFSLNTVQCVGVWHLLVLICQIFYTEGFVKINNLLSDGTVETQILHSDPLAIEVSNLWENQVNFVSKNAQDETEEKIDGDRFLWIEKSWKSNRDVRQDNEPSNQKRVPRQSNAGYSSLYPTLPTTGSYGYYGSHDFNNVTNSSRQFPSNSNYTSSGSNPYQYNSQYPPHNGLNYNYPQYKNNFNPGSTNGTYRPTTNYNNSGNTQIPQAPNRQFYPGATNNFTNIASQQTTNRPFYPGATNFGTNFTYQQSPNVPFSPPQNNHTFPGSVYPQTSGTSIRPWAVNSTKYPSYPAPTNRPFYPGANTNNTNPSFSQTGNRPSYPGPYFNGTNPSYHNQQTNKPLYPAPNNKPMQHTYPPSPRPINHYNSMPSFNNAQNNSRLPSNNFPGFSPNNTQIGYPYPTYSTNGSSQGTLGPQRPLNNTSGPFNSYPYGSQGYGQNYNTNHSSTNNFNSNYPYPKPNNYTANYQHFGNVPQNQYPGYPNSAPNQNAGSEQNSFFYPAPNSQPSYDPRKNPPNQFSYNH